MKIMANRMDRGFFRYQKEFEDKALEVLRSGCCCKCGKHDCRYCFYSHDVYLSCVVSVSLVLRDGGRAVPASGPTPYRRSIRLFIFQKMSVFSIMPVKFSEPGPNA